MDRSEPQKPISTIVQGISDNVVGSSVKRFLSTAQNQSRNGTIDC